MRIRLILTSQLTEQDQCKKEKFNFHVADHLSMAFSRDPSDQSRVFLHTDRVLTGFLRGNNSTKRLESKKKSSDFEEISIHQPDIKDKRSNSAFIKMRFKDQ